MSRTLTVTDDLYGRLETAARQRGLSGVEQLLVQWQASAEELQCRRESVQKIAELRNRLFAAYGEMPDSVKLIREDRAR